MSDEQDKSGQLSDLQERTEEALRTSEKRFKSLFEQAGDYIIVLEPQPDGPPVIVDANQAAIEKHGFTRDELIGKPISDLHAEPNRKLIAKRVKKMLAGEHMVFEVTHIRKDGTAFPVEVSAKLLDVGEGPPLIMSIERDITERARAETAQRLNAQIMANMPGGVVLVRSSDGVIVYVNSKYEETYGYGPGELVGKHISIVNAPTDKSPEQTAGEIIDALDRNGAWKGEVLNIRKDGTEFWSYASVSMFDHPEHGAVSVGINTDITERKQAEEALRASQERFEQVAEHAQEWIWEIDADGLYTYASPVVEKILGYSPEEIVGKKHFYDLFHPEQRQEIKTAAFEAFARKESFRGFPNLNVHKNGQPIWLSTSGVPLLDGGGGLVGYRGADTDITERKNAEIILRKSEEKHRTIAETIPGIIYRCAADWTFLFTTNAIEELTGFPASDFINNKVRSYESIMNEDDTKIIEKSVNDAITKKQPFYSTHSHPIAG
ncbi:MAG: PAS domain S-box protein [Phycisphaerae bacterium]|jgi:PAS domain S-box-containing protein|nr:PAS domain S-box protein [Phycisphaerae bacterium]